MGGVRPNASEISQISPSTTVRAARAAGKRRNLASVLREGRNRRTLAPVQEPSGKSRFTAFRPRRSIRRREAEEKDVNLICRNWYICIKLSMRIITRYSPDGFRTSVISALFPRSGKPGWRRGRVNAGGILQRQAGVKVQHGRKQEGPRYRGPSCLSRFIPEGQPPTAVLTVLGVTGAWSERA